MIFRVFAICTVILLQNVIRAEDSTEKPKQNVSAVAGTPKSGLSWINDGISGVENTIAPSNEAADALEGRNICRRRKKHRKRKLLIPILMVFLLIKAILLPIALKGLAVLSGKAVVLSLMSLILAAIVGLKKVAQNTGPTGHGYDLGYGYKYRRNDLPLDDRINLENDDPYRFYRGARRRK